jgi:uncharacterized membrane protein YgcG
LPIGEQVIYNKVSGRSGGFRIDKANGKSVVSLASGFRSKLASEHRNKYFVRNLPWIIAGVMMSAAAVAISLSSAGSDAGTIVPIMFGAIVISSMLVMVFNALSKSHGPGRMELCRHCALGRVRHHRIELPARTRRHAGVHRKQPAAADRHGSIVVLNALFWYLLGAPTPLGQRTDGRHRGPQDLYQAGRDRPPQPARRTGHVAQAIMKPCCLMRWPSASKSHGPTPLPPGWQPRQVLQLQPATARTGISGDRFNAGNIGSSLGSVADSISSSMTNAAPAPSSSSSGFSGGGGGGSGGGGGGGGGGW